MSRVTPLSLVFLALVSSAQAQNNNGLWDPPFNHAVPANWLPGQPRWDNETLSPHVSPTDPDPHRFMAGHMALIPTGPHRGKVLAWNYMRAPVVVGSDNLQHWSVIDLSTTPPTFTNDDLAIPLTDGDLFCSGHAWTKDGDLLVAGGNKIGGGGLQANQLAYRFNPRPSLISNAMWKREPDLQYHRWYPTVTALGTDRADKDVLLVTGGLDWAFVDNSLNTYEAFDPTNPAGSGTWQVDPNTLSRIFPGPAVSCNDFLLIYPRPFLLTSGKVFFAGKPELGYRVDHTQVSTGISPTWEIHANPSTSMARWYASAFLYPNLGGPLGGFQDVVVRVGGGTVTMANCLPSTPYAPEFTSEFCLAGLASTDPNWIWFSGPPLSLGLPSARYHQNATLLPDASVAVIGGNLDQNEFTCGQPVLDTEILNDDPSAPHTFRAAAPSTVRRGYHSTSLLLPDASVLVAGGEDRERDYQIFRPHYLTNGTQRPQIVGAPATLAMKYGKTYTLSYAAMGHGVTVERAVLMAPGSITHHTDMHQRYVEMETVPVSPPPPPANQTFSFKAPPNANHAPRGFYMLFLVSSVQSPANRRTPSTAIWVNLQ